MASEAVLPPFPKGWYSVGFSDEFPRGSVTTRRLGGREVVLFRTEDGALGAVDPVCPHLGAHLGHGGTVVGRALRCPFHGFTFGTDGTCLSTGYGTKPPRTSIGTWHVFEDHEVVLLWLDPRGGPPTFHVPRLDLTAFLPQKRAKFSLRGHPQDTTENSVDIGHLGVVHGYERPRMIGDLVTDGASLRATYEFFRPVGLLGSGFGGVLAEFDAHVHGLGYSYVATRIPSLGLEYKNFVYATPVDDMALELRISATLRSLDASPLSGPLRAVKLSKLASRLVERLVHERSFRIFESDVLQDFVIWQNKRFVAKPALAAGDGPILRYRRWAAQFYEGQTAQAAGAGVDVSP